MSNVATKTISTDQYWATLPDEELIGSLENRVDAYYRWVAASSRRSLWAAAYNQYYAAIFNGADINLSGSQLEYHMMSVNQTRNIIKHLMNLTISQRPAFEPRASNTDSKSQKQTVIARSLLQYYLREKGMEGRIRTALEYAVLYGEGFVSATWNPDDGDSIGTNPESGIEVHEGDMAYEAYEPMDVIRDVALADASSSTWYIAKKFRNRWDLIARFPEHRESLLASPSMKNPLRNFKMQRNVLVDDTDLIEVFEFFHARTAAVPKGRYSMFVYGADCLLTSVLPYHDMPLYRLSADDIGGQPFGYGTIFDLLNVQQAVDGAYSTIQTNGATFGVQNIIVPKGANLTPTQVSDGLNLIEYSNTPGGGKPEAINFLQTAPETFNHLNKLESVLEQLAGINSIIRGEAPAGMSGSAMALLQAQAVQFVQGLQSSYVKLLEDLGTGTIGTLRDYATTKRVVAIVGKSQRSNLAEFTGDDLSTINRVLVDVGNPLMRTVAGKLQVAQDLLGAGLIKNPIEYLGVIETGNLETMMEGPMNALMSIKAENESLSDGKPVFAMVLDDHKLHIAEHATVISDPAVRNDAARLEAAMTHIQEHWALWNDPANAGILAACGVEPPMGGQGATQAPTSASPVAGDANSLAAANQPSGPKLPELPGGAMPLQ